MNGRRRAAEKKIRRAKANRPERECLPGLEWLAESAGGEMRITLFGSRRALVERHCGVAAFSQGCIKLRSKRGIVEFVGEGLSFGEIRSEAMVVSGRICSVNLPGGDGHD